MFSFLSKYLGSLSWLDLAGWRTALGEVVCLLLLFPVGLVSSVSQSVPFRTRVILIALGRV